MSLDPDRESAQLTQDAGPALDLLTQHPPESNVDISPTFLTSALEAQFKQDRASLIYDGLVFESGGEHRPLAFFRNAEDPLDVSVGRSETSDIIVRSKDGKCGVS